MILLTILIKPVLGLLDGVEDSLLVLVIDLATKTLLVVNLVLQAEGIVLETVASLNALLGGLVFLGVLLGLGDHAVNFLLDVSFFAIVTGWGR